MGTLGFESDRSQEDAVKVRLEPFTRGDFARLTGWVNSPEALAEWAGKFFSFPLDEPQLERYVADAGGEHPVRRIYRAVDASTGEVLGHAELSHIWPHLSGRLSRILIGRPAHRGHGLGAQLVRQLLQESFAAYGFHRLDLGVLESNAAGLRCYEKCGFQRVGLWPGAFTVGERELSVCWMTCFRADWERLRTD